MSTPQKTKSFTVTLSQGVRLEYKSPRQINKSEESTSGQEDEDIHLNKREARNRHKNSNIAKSPSKCNAKVMDVSESGKKNTNVNELEIQLAQYRKENAKLKLEKEAFLERIAALEKKGKSKKV